MSDKPLWKRALSVVADFDDASKPTLPASPSAATVVAPAPLQPTDGYASIPTVAPDSQPALFDTLMKAALSRKTIFSGLLDSAERLRTVVPDETQRIKAAAALAGPVTADSITSAVASHLQDVQGERTKFNREIADVKTTKVDTPKAQATQIEGQVATAQAEIQRLTASITQLTAQATGLREQATAAQTDLDNTVCIFEAAAFSVEQRLKTLRDAVTSALK